MPRRKTNPIVAALFGILLVPGSMVLQAWNEYRTIHRTHGLNEAEEIVETINDVDSVNTGLNGKLVHLAGDAATDERLRDPKFGVEVNAIQLRRTVEMYQWEEDEHTNDGDTTYSYNKVWKQGRIDSDTFHHSAQHQNSFPTFDSWEKFADDVMVGKYEVSDALKRQKTDHQKVDFDLENVRQSVGNDHARRLTVNGSQLYYSASASFPSATGASSGNHSQELAEETGAEETGTAPEEPSPEIQAPSNAQSDVRIDVSTPQVGDLRIQFEMVPNGPVSLMAGLKGNTFASFKTSNGEPIERLYAGMLTADQVVENMRSENSTIAWLLRGVGFVLCLVGMLMIFSPAQALFRWIPLVGDITGGLILVVSFGVAVVLSLLTISISWIAVRPILAIGLLIIAGGIVYLLRRAKKSVDHSDSQNFDDQPIMLTDDMMVTKKP